MTEGLVATIGTTSGTLFNTNRGRLGLEITNTHASQIIYVRIGTEVATATDGIPITAGATLAWPRTSGGPVPGGPIQVIGSGAATTLYAIEHSGANFDA